MGAFENSPAPVKDGPELKRKQHLTK
jgi:hypothetical protein